ncbi:MAG: ferredoxin--NADP reductase [Cytophagaceae bacterium]|jgi:ring-1,2-phenylacetyl-CoA epoxidase subunit PaaE|nr:ferredoxin--NADP reductase [Cytophagaceae bacterium]
MSKEITYTLVSVRQETADALSLVLQPSEAIQYQAGQYLTLFANIQGEEIRRCYSFSTAPSEQQLPTVTLKKVPGGKMTTWLFEHAKPGLTLQGYTPMGNFVLPSQAPEHLVYLGGGSGITPLFSMIRETRLSNPRKQYLFYTNLNESSTIFRGSLQEEVVRGANVQVHHHYTDVQGLPTATAVSNWIQAQAIAVQASEFFICGPQGLMAVYEEALKALQVPADRIHKEVFQSAPAPLASSLAEEKEYSVTIQFQKKTYSVLVPVGKSILQSALDNKIRLPHSCQSGLCTACMGQCLSGQVTMTDPEGLSDNEIKKGCVLTCVGRPASEGVVIRIE